MNSLLRFFSLATICAAFVVSAVGKTAEVGQAAPDFTLTDLDGKSVSLSDFKGKTVVLEWVNPDCPFVQRHYSTGNMPGLQKEATSDGVVWLQINSGSKGAEGDYEPAKAKEWLKKQNAASTDYFRDQDGKVGHLYGAKTTPHMYVINPQGVLVYAGGIDDNRKNHVGARNYVREALAAVKEGKPVAKPTADPYGCSVKY